MFFQLNSKSKYNSSIENITHPHGRPDIHKVESYRKYGKKDYSSIFKLEASQFSKRQGESPLGKASDNYFASIHLKVRFHSQFFILLNLFFIWHVCAVV